MLGAITGSLIFHLLLFLLRVILRKEWIAEAGFVALFAGVQDCRRTNRGGYRHADVEPTDFWCCSFCDTVFWRCTRFVRRR